MPGRRKGRASVQPSPVPHEAEGGTPPVSALPAVGERDLGMRPFVNLQLQKGWLRQPRRSGRRKSDAVQGSFTLPGYLSERQAPRYITTVRQKRARLADVLDTTDGSDQAAAAAEEYSACRDAYSRGLLRFLDEGYPPEASQRKKQRSALPTRPGDLLDALHSLGAHLPESAAPVVMSNAFVGLLAYQRVQAILASRRAASQGGVDSEATPDVTTRPVVECASQQSDLRGGGGQAAGTAAAAPRFVSAETQTLGGALE